MAERCPICHTILETWDEDPLKTPRGLAGSNYKGKDPCRFWHLLQLRKRIEDTETELGITPTEWKEVINNKTPIRYYHIIECRNAIENILGITELTSPEDRAELLIQYFNYDEEGTHYGIEDREEWIDLDLDKATPIRAIHIEDLRRPNLLLGRWDQQDWQIKVGEVFQDWSISYPPPADGGGFGIQTHPIKTGATRTHEWSGSHSIENESKVAGGITFTKTGTAFNSGSNSNMISNGYQLSQMQLPAGVQILGSIGYGDTAAFKKYTPLLIITPQPERCKLITSSKIRFIWSTTLTPYLETTFGSNPTITKKQYGEAYFEIFYYHPSTSPFSWTSVRYGRGVVSTTALSISNGDITRDAYADYISFIGNPPPADSILSRVEIYSNALSSITFANADSLTLGATQSASASSDLNISSIIFSSIGNVSI